jgi:hypothetical protein
MVEGAPARLVLDVRGAGAAPTGTLTGPDGTCTSFEGWLQLLAALGNAFDELDRLQVVAEPDAPKQMSAP